MKIKIDVAVQWNNNTRKTAAWSHLEWQYEQRLSGLWHKNVHLQWTTYRFLCVLYVLMFGNRKWWAFQWNQRDCILFSITHIKLSSRSYACRFFWSKSCSVWSIICNMFLIQQLIAVRKTIHHTFFDIPRRGHWNPNKTPCLCSYMNGCSTHYNTSHITYAKMLQR